MNRRKIQIILTLTLFLLLVFFASKPFTMSIYKWGEPVFTLNGETVTTRDLFDTVSMFAMATTSCAFLVLIWFTLKKKRR